MGASFVVRLALWLLDYSIFGIFFGGNRRIVQSVAAMRMTKMKTIRMTYSSDHGTTVDWICFQLSLIFQRGNPTRIRATSRPIPAHATKISPKLKFSFHDFLAHEIFRIITHFFYCFFAHFDMQRIVISISGSAYFLFRSFFISIFFSAFLYHHQINPESPILWAM